MVHTLTIQPSLLHIHGAVLGPLQTVCMTLLVASLHKQLAIETYLYTISQSFDYVHS